MAGLNVKKIMVSFFICPNCGSEFQSLYGNKKGYFCNKCGYDFTNELNDHWEEKETDAIICDKCGRKLI